MQQEISVKTLAGGILMYLNFFTVLLNLCYLCYQESFCHRSDKTFCYWIRKMNTDKRLLKMMKI